MANKSEKGEDRCFFRDSSLHGVKYLREPGHQRLVWLLVTAASCTITFFFFRGTMTEYMNENTKMLVNSTNTPLTDDDFPVITLCNVNLVSLYARKVFLNHVTRTFESSKELGQPCNNMIKACYYRKANCEVAIKAVLTESGWCCRLDVRDVEGTSPEEFGTPSSGVYLSTDVQTYDYLNPAWFTEGIMVTVNSVGSYPEVFFHSTFLAPGTNNMMRLQLTRTYTTQKSLRTRPEERDCFKTDESPLKHFREYSQSNCFIDHVIKTVEDECGCIGKYRGFRKYENETEECEIKGSISWMDDNLDYHQCNDRNTSLSEVMGGMTCPAKCLVNCEEDRFSVELSSSVLPGFMTFCASYNDIYEKVACMFQKEGRSLGKHVCDTLPTFRKLAEKKPEKNVLHVIKREQLCPQIYQDVWERCKDEISATPMYSYDPRASLVECIGQNTTVEEALELKAVVDQYARENTAVVQIMFKEKYYTSIKRDVAYTFSSLVANVGGLLGLSMGCSFISLAELVLFPVLNAFASDKRGKKRKRKNEYFRQM